MTPPRVPIVVRLELGSALAKLIPEQKPFSTVERYVRDLLEDLDLPAEARVQHSTPQGTPADALRIWIDDQPCRIALLADEPPDAAALTRRIDLVLHANRSLFASDRVLAALWSWWTNRPGPCPNDIKEALRFLVHLSLSVNHAQGILSEANPGLPAEAVERLVTHSAGEFHITVSLAAHAGLPLTGGTQAAPDVPQRLRAMNDLLFWELGLLLPLGAIAPDARLGADEFAIQINDLRMPPQLLVGNGEFVVNVISSASAAIRQSAESFLTTDSVDFCCARLGEAFPDMVARALAAFSPIFLTRLERSLLREEISVRDLRALLEALLAFNGRTHVDFSKFIVFFLDPDALVGTTTGFGNGVEGLVRDHAEAVRMSFKHWISNKYAGGGNTLVVYLLASEVEARLTDPAPLPDNVRGELVQAIVEQLRHLPPSAIQPVILTTASVRARLRREIERELPYVAVVSFQELSPHMNIQPIARISPGWGSSPPPPPVSPAASVPTLAGAR